MKGEGKQLTLLVVNETRQVERNEVIQSRQREESVPHSLLRPSVFLSCFLFLLHLAALSYPSSTFQGPISSTATVCATAEAPLGNAATVAVK